MDEETLAKMKKMVESLVQKGLARFDSLCKEKCRRNCTDSCRIDSRAIAIMWDFVEGKNPDGREIIKVGGGINETRPIHSIFDPTGPLSVREKIFDFFGIENNKLGVMILREMANSNERFKIFLIKICLYAQDQSMYRYADDQEMYRDIFG